MCTDNFEEKLNLLPPKFTWNENSPFMFQQALNSNGIQNKIKDFMKQDFGNTDSLDTATDFSDILKNEATMLLKSTNIKKKKKKKKQ